MERELAISHPHATLHNAKRFVNTDKLVTIKQSDLSEKVTYFIF